MNCYLHKDKEPVVALCGSCNRGLCPACSEFYKEPTCHFCADEQNSQHKKSILKNFIVGLLLVVIFSFLIFSKLDFNLKVGSTYAQLGILFLLIFSIPFSWSFITRLQPLYLTEASIIIWYFYLFFKLALAMFIGPLVLPYYVYRAFKDLREIRRIRGNAQQQLVLINSE